MGDCFGKLGDLLSQKINDSENSEKALEEKNSVEERESAFEADKNINRISPKLIFEAVRNKPEPKAEIVHAGQYEEDVPVKIITGEAEFK